MAFTIPNFHPAIPEAMVFILGSLVLLVHAFVGQHRPKLIYGLVQFIILLTACVTARYLNVHSITTFNGLFVLDHFAVLLKVTICISVFLTFLYSRNYIADREIPTGEFYILGLFSMLGMMVLVSGHHFLTLFLGLELMSLPVYAMVALQRDNTVCTEAAIKYFIIGAMATGMLLYGMSMIYGATGQLDVSMIAKTIAARQAQQPLIFTFGLVFVLVGLAFKLGAVPFHMWIPDVYEGAPSAVTLFIASAPKVAALGLAVRLLVDAMPAMQFQWTQVLIALAILSMGLGNFAAIAQSNIKRMLAYSSIAHMGYMVLGLVAGSSDGYAAATFYMITYALMTLAAFGLIIMMSRTGFECENIDDFKGLNSRSPWLAFIMMIVMFSLAGVPPIVGFMAKMNVILAIVEANLIWLAAIALLFAVVGSYYYIRVVKVMYFEEPETTDAINYPRDLQIALSLNGITILAVGMFPGLLLELCKAAF